MKQLTPSTLHVHNTIINTSITSDTPLNRWTIADVIMIQKESNNSKINKLRVINKLEASYNLVLKYHQPHQPLTTQKKESS